MPSSIVGCRASRVGLRFVCAGLIGCLGIGQALAQAPSQETSRTREAAFSATLVALVKQLPVTADQFDAARGLGVTAACDKVDFQAGTVLYGVMQRPDEWLDRLRVLTRAKTDVDGHLQQLL